MIFLQIANKPCSMVSGARRSSADDNLCSLLFCICEKSARYPRIRLMLSFICWKYNVRSFTFSKLNCWKPGWKIEPLNYSFLLKIGVACLCNNSTALSVTQRAMKESRRQSKSDHFYNFQVYPKDSWIFLRQVMSRFKLIFAGKTWISKNRERKLTVGKYLMQMLIFGEIDSRKMLYLKGFESFRKTLVLNQSLFSQ